MHPALLLSLLDFSEHQGKVEMVETQDAHEAIQKYSCEKIIFGSDRSPRRGDLVRACVCVCVCPLLSSKEH